MKTDLVKLKDLLDKTNNELQKNIIAYYISYGEEFKSHMEDVINHGCISGCVSHLIYYKDTNDYYQRFSTEIWDLLVEESDSCGYDNYLEFIAGQNGSINVNNEEQFFNFLSWYAFECVSSWILSELGEY